MQCFGSLEAAEKHIAAEILKKKSCRSGQIRKDRKPGIFFKV